jgi:hypothetical protein
MPSGVKFGSKSTSSPVHLLDTWGTQEPARPTVFGRSRTTQTFNVLVALPVDKWRADLGVRGNRDGVASVALGVVGVGVVGVVVGVWVGGGSVVTEFCVSWVDVAESARRSVDSVSSSADHTKKPAVARVTKPTANRENIQPTLLVDRKLVSAGGCPSACVAGHVRFARCAESSDSTGAA